MRTRLPHGGEAAGVVLGAEQVGLDDTAGLREVLPQLLVDGEHRVEGGVVLGVQGDRGADRGRCLDDRADVGERHLVAALQSLAEHRELDGHLGPGAQAEVLQAVDQLQVRVARGGGLLGRRDVLADDVEGDLEALPGGVLDDRDDLLDRLAGDEPVDDLLGPRSSRNETAHLVTARRSEDHGSQHGAPPTERYERGPYRQELNQTGTARRTTVKSKDPSDHVPSTAVTHPCPGSQTYV